MDDAAASALDHRPADLGALPKALKELVTKIKLSPATQDPQAIPRQPTLLVRGR